MIRCRRALRTSVGLCPALGGLLLGACSEGGVARTDDGVAVISQALVSISITSPAANATVRGTVNVTASASDGSGINRVEFLVDNVLRHTDTTSPYSFRWDAFHELLGTLHSTGLHQLTVVAFANSGASTSANRTVRVAPALAGDCNGSGSVTSADATAIGSEINDGDGTNPENSGGGSFAGNPACDANEDNVINSADQSCANLIASSGNPAACLNQSSSLVMPLIFVPSDMTGQVNSTVETFVKDKIQEAKRFYAKNNLGRTFRALPLQTVIGFRTKAEYYGADPSFGSFETAMFIELEERGFPTWNSLQDNRVVWVVAMGAGGRAAGFSVNSLAGLSWIGDGVLFAGLDLNCDRVVAHFPGDPVEGDCRTRWFNAENPLSIYGFSIGAYVHELGHAFNLPHPPGDAGNNTNWVTSVMGHHQFYPGTGLSSTDRGILAASAYFPGGGTCGALPWSSHTDYSNGAIVSADCRHQHLSCSATEMGKDFRWQCIAAVPSWCRSFRPGSNQNYANIWQQLGQCNAGVNYCSEKPWASEALYLSDTIVTATCNSQQIACSATEMNKTFTWQCISTIQGQCNDFQPGSNQNYSSIWEQLKQCN